MNCILSKAPTRLATSALCLAALLGLRCAAAAPAATKPLPTLAPIASDQSFTFVVLGDNRGGNDGEQPEAFRQILRAIGPLAPGFVINTGDMIYGHTRDDHETRVLWRRYHDTIAPLRLPFFHVPGNHDIWDQASEKLYRELCGPSFYAFDYGCARFIGLDSETSPGQLGQEQFAWLKRQLEECPQSAAFIIVHRPLFPVDGATGLSLDRFPEERDRLHELFIQYRHLIKGVFQGHEHLYHAGRRDGVSYYITGGAGANLYAPPELGGFHHFLLVRVDSSEVRVDLKKVAAPSRPLEAPVPIRPGTLLEGWDRSLSWYCWDYTVLAETTADRASEGQRALRLNFDLAQNAWPVLSLRQLPARQWSRAEAFSVDVFVPDELKAVFALTAGVEDVKKREALPVQLRQGWNTVRTDLRTLPDASAAGTPFKNLGWTLTSDDHSARGWVLFDNFTVTEAAGPEASATVLVEGWESPLLWRTFDESVTAVPASDFRSQGTSSIKTGFDFSVCDRPMLAARLNPPWDLRAVGSLAVDVYVPEGLSGSLTAFLAFRSMEREYSGPGLPLQSGWNQVRAELNEAWLPRETRAAAEQVQWMLSSTNPTLKGWVVFDNLRADTP